MSELQKLDPTMPLLAWPVPCPVQATASQGAAQVVAARLRWAELTHRQERRMVAVAVDWGAAAPRLPSVRKCL
eukprot:472684-Amphidinium_carterae.2